MARPPLEPLVRAPQKALKEWAVVCRALATGRQSVLLRKGGIVEETRDFRLVENRFLLYPTFEHQDPSSLRPEYRGLFPDRPPGGAVRIEAWAEVTDLFLTHDLKAVLDVGDLYAWSADYVHMRMAYKPRKPMNVVVVRVWRLPRPVDIEVRDYFAGCKSWVPLEEPVSLDASTAVLDEEEHGRRVERVESVLGPSRVPIETVTGALSPRVFRP